LTGYAQGGATLRSELPMVMRSSLVGDERVEMQHRLYGQSPQQSNIYTIKGLFTEVVSTLPYESRLRLTTYLH